MGGDFHKDYDRLMTAASMETFLRDPTGDAPWEEDEESRDVLFLNDAKTFNAALKKDKKGMMVMFYAVSMKTLFGCPHNKNNNRFKITNLNIIFINAILALVWIL